jgi:hypothetical protein
MSTLTIPTTPAGTQFAAWLGAINSGSESTLRAWRSQSCPYPNSNINPAHDTENDTIAGDLAFCARTGGLDVLRIVTSEETKIEVVLKQRNTGREMKVAVWAEAGEPFVTRITIHPLGEGGGVQIDTLEFRECKSYRSFRYKLSPDLHRSVEAPHKRTAKTQLVAPMY